MTDDGRPEKPLSAADLAEAPLTEEAAAYAQFPFAQSQSSYWKGTYDNPADLALDQAYRDDDEFEPSSAEMRQLYALQAVRQRDHIAAGLLAVFLGAFGIHKFYLGYNQTAFIMLAVTVIGSIFTFGLAGAVVGLIAVVEGVIYLTKSQTEFDRIYVLNQRDWF